MKGNISVRSGNLDRRITIKVLDNARDEFNMPIQTYTPLFSDIPAGYRPLSGREVQMAGSDRAMKMVVFTIRYTNQVNESHVIEYDGTDYRIESINEINRREGLQIMAERRDQSV